MTERLRRPREDDHPRLAAAVRHWWGDSRSPEAARELSLLLPRLFLQHFAGTSLVAERERRLVGFLIGFHSADQPDTAYIHFVGVDPGLRGTGLGRRLYEAFFASAVQAGRHRIDAITSPGNSGSIAFHRSMGFTVLTGPSGSDTHPDYDGPGQDRVCLRKILS